MNILDDIASFAETAYNGIKTGLDYGVQWLTYIVTLGNSDYPRVKETQKKAQMTQIVPRVIILEDREVLESKRRNSEGEKFIQRLNNTISTNGAEEFKKSEEYKEGYLKDLNPFSSIERYYQKFSAKTFLATLEQEARNNFVQSKDYQNFLDQDPFSTETNPFSSGFAEPIENIYQKYMFENAQMQKEKLENYRREVYDFFYKEEDLDEQQIKEAFRESQSYRKLMDKLETDYKFSLSLADIKEQYKKFKDNIDVENQQVLDRFADKENFINSLEYKRISQKTPKNIEEAYKNYTVRVKKAGEFDAYMQSLKTDSEKFDRLEKSNEYKGVNLAPENLERLKGAVQMFAMRDFKERIAESNRDFLETEPYKQIINNPFSSFREIQEAYNVYLDKKRVHQDQEREQYLKELKAALNKETGNDDYYNKFLDSTIFKEIWVSTERTRKDVESAFKEFQSQNPRTWGQWFLGS